MTLPLAQFLAVWVFLGLNIASPGPNVLNTIASAMGSGRRAGMGSALAVGFGVVLWCLGMSLGMAAVFAAVPAAQAVLTLVAVALLFWFAARYLLSAWAGYHGWQGVPGGATGLNFTAAFRRSLLVNVMNPKALSSWLAILAIFPVASARGGRHCPAVRRVRPGGRGPAHAVRAGLFHPGGGAAVPACGMGTFGLCRAVLCRIRPAVAGESGLW
jgi:threonine/homoserine/homoserine lactone efflux protein